MKMLQLPMMLRNVTMVGLVLAMSSSFTQAAIVLPGSALTPIPNGTMITLDAATYALNSGVGDAILTINHSGAFDTNNPSFAAGGNINLRTDGSANPQTVSISFSFDKAVVVRIADDQFSAGALEDYTISVSNGAAVFYDDFAGGSGNGSGSVTVQSENVDNDWDVTFGGAPDGVVLGLGNYANYAALAPGTVITYTYTEVNGLSPAQETFQLDVFVVPEPSKSILLLGGMAVLMLRGRSSV